jgi:putative nucleotidyltransferase with HDIG domain
VRRPRADGPAPVKPRRAATEEKLAICVPGGEKFMEERVVLKTILRTQELPTLPDVVHQILEITGDPLSSTRLLTRVIERDPPLCANLLKLVNSAYFGFSRKIHAVHDAAVLLGYATIRGLALGTSVITSLKVGGGLDAHRFWDHSLACALAADALGRDLEHPQADMAFIGGLLHDVGILPLVLSFPEADWPPRPQGGEGALEAEARTFGLAHPDAGGAIARAWKFPPDLTRAIEEHHRCDDGAPDKVSPLARLIALAEWFVQEDHPLAGHVLRPEAHAVALARSLGHDLAAVMKSAPRVTEALGQIDALLQFETG